jgi:hypothetical protein
VLEHRDIWTPHSEASSRKSRDKGKWKHEIKTKSEHKQVCGFQLTGDGGPFSGGCGAGGGSVDVPEATVRLAAGNQILVKVFDSYHATSSLSMSRMGGFLYGDQILGHGARFSTEIYTLGSNGIPLGSSLSYQLTL